MDSIKTFDKNKDGVIDEEEIQLAISKAKAWAMEADTFLSKSDWLYYGQDAPVGPMKWNDILEIHKKYPEVFISKDKVNSGASQKSINWLPAKLVVETAKIIK